MKISDAVIIALIACIPPTLTAAGALIVSINTQSKVEEVHKATNSMKDALVASTRSEALIEGHAEGVKDEKARLLPNRHDKEKQK